MEDLLPSMKEKLKKKIEIKVDEQQLTISLIVKGDISGKLLYPGEIPIMLKLYGGLREDLQMEINADEKEQTIEIILKNKDDFRKIQVIMKSIWENAVEMFEELLNGYFDSIKGVPNIDD
jgi:hypothetical protein